MHAAQEGGDGRRRPRVLLGVTGSVAAVKAPELAVRLVKETEAEVCVVLTQGGEHFWKKAAAYDPKSWKAYLQLLAGDERVSKSKETDGADGEQKQVLICANGGVSCVGPNGSSPSRIQVHHALEEWESWEELGDAVLHIDLRNWADVAVVAPMSAHSLAKIANGLADDVLSCCLRAWDYGRQPLLLAPAMNTAMWNHPLTNQQLTQIANFAPPAGPPVHVVQPQTKLLACGEVGNGALAPLDDVLAAVKRALAPMQG